MKKQRIVEVRTPQRSWWGVQTRSWYWPFWVTRQCCPHIADAQEYLEGLS